MMTRLSAAAASACAAVLLALAPVSSDAASIYVNGTQVDGALSDVTLEKCTAVFDAKGDLRLNCPGYNFTFADEDESAPAAAAEKQASQPVSTSQAAVPPKAPSAVPASAAEASPTQLAQPPALSAKYVLFSSQSENIGAAGFDVDVFINGVIAVRLKNDDVQIVEDVTRFLKKGANSVTFVARKKPSIRDVQASSNDYIEIQIIEGSIDPATETLTVTAGTGITYRITAAEKADSTKEMKVTAR